MTKSLEDYLEAIYRLQNETGAAHVTDVAQAMKVTMPSVNNAVKELARLGLVNYEPYRELELTQTGLNTAKNIFDCHMMLKKFLRSFGISEENAESDACAMEHVLSTETLDCFRKATATRKCDSPDETKTKIR